MQGLPLLNLLLEATGLPKEAVQKEIISRIRLAGLKEDNISMDELRQLIVDYLQDTLPEVKSQLS